MPFKMKRKNQVIFRYTKTEKIIPNVKRRPVGRRKMVSGGNLYMYKEMKNKYVRFSSI